MTVTASPRVVPPNLAPCLGAWEAFSYTGVVSLTSVQLEESAEASPFVYEDYNKTLEKCQRFYETGTATIAVVTDGTDMAPAAFKTVQMKRTKRNKSDIFVTVDETSGGIDLATAEVGYSDTRKFTVQVNTTGGIIGLHKLKLRWVADSELPLYNNLQLDEQGEVGRTTVVCDSETACTLAESCKANADAPSCVPGYFPQRSFVENGAFPTSFKVFFSEIPSSEVDSEFATELGDTWGGLCHYFYENSVETWPNVSDDKSRYYMLVTGPRFDTNGSAVDNDPNCPLASDGTGRVWAPGAAYSGANANKSFRGRWGWGMPDGSSNLQDARTVSDFSLTNLDFETKTFEALAPNYFNYGWANFYDWEYRGCSGPPQIAGPCPGALRQDPMLSESVNYIYARLTGPTGQTIEVTYNSVVENSQQLVRFCQTAPVSDYGFSGTPVGWYGLPYIDNWSRPLIRDANNNPISLGYENLTDAQRDQLITYYYNRWLPLFGTATGQADYTQPSLYNLYSSTVLGTGVPGNVNNGNPSAPYYSPFMSRGGRGGTPWNGASTIQTAWERNNYDKVKLSKLYPVPSYPAVGPMFYGAGHIISWGSEYTGWHYTTMCNPSCRGTTTESTSPSGVTGTTPGSCYEGDWRCWDVYMGIEDFCRTQLDPVLQNNGDGVVFWWSPTYSTKLATAQVSETISPAWPGPSGGGNAWWNSTTDINPDLTQWNIDHFPVEITGTNTDANGVLIRLKRNDTDVPVGSRIARWWNVIDNHPTEVKAEIDRLGMSNASITGWLNSFTTNPNTGQKWLVASRQQIYNARNGHRMFIKAYLLDGADPAAGGVSSPTGRLAGVGWYSPSLHRFLKVAWSKFALHYAKAAKQYAETRTYAAEWNEVTAFGGQVAFDAILEQIRLDPLNWIPDVGSM
jgi:hypothetical protein